jgi:hypothetical protein
MMKISMPELMFSSGKKIDRHNRVCRISLQAVMFNDEVDFLGEGRIVGWRGRKEYSS